MKALVQEGQSSNTFSLLLVEFLRKIQNSWDEKAPRTTANFRKGFVCFTFSTVESENATKMATETTCHHHIKSEAMLSLQPEQKKKKAAENYKLFFPTLFQFI